MVGASVVSLVSVVSFEHPPPHPTETTLMKDSPHGNSDPGAQNRPFHERSWAPDGWEATWNQPTD